MPVDSHPFMMSFQDKHVKIRDEFNAYLKSPEIKGLYAKYGVVLNKAPQLILNQSAIPNGNRVNQHMAGKSSVVFPFYQPVGEH